MELSYTELRQREVVNITDGRCYGRVCDIVFNYPEGKIFGIVVPGKKGWNCFRCSNDVFIEFHKIKKIGTDVILVDLRTFREPKRPKYCDPCSQMFSGKDNDKDDESGKINIDTNDYE